jgi:hypothetical protein
MKLQSAWLLSERHLANRCTEGVLLFVIATFCLAFLIGMRHGTDAPRLLVMTFLALSSWLGVLIVRRSRRHFEAAGLSQEEVGQEMASTWRIGAWVMILIGAFAFVLVALGADLLDRSELLWVLGSTSGYTAIGLLLLWKNQRKRGT